MISVIMPVYNNSKFVRESIDCILKQTYDDFEFIILDDASTEPTWDIIQSYDDPRIVKVQNEKNIGLTRSLNICLDIAKGDYIARHDSDDVCTPFRFEKEMALFDERVGLVSSWAYRFEGDYVLSDPWLKREVKWLKREVKFSNEKIKKHIKKANCIVGPSAIYTRAVFEKIGYYDEELYLAQDYNYWIRLLSFFDVRILHEPLYGLRRHTGSVRTVRSRKDNTDWVQKCKDRAKTNPIIKEHPVAYW